MKSCLTLFTFFLLLNIGKTQNETAMDANKNTDLPYYQIPDYPEKYTSATVAARMIDGLGFRYYWATENLREEDLKFRPNDEARTVLETLDHIYSLSQVIVNAAKNQPNIRPVEEQNFTFEQLRKKTLENFKEASDLLKADVEKDLGELTMVFQRSEKTTEFPFWNLINGPIADAIWHVGQVVSFRRSSGNPLNPKVSVLNGKLRD
jgi:uncharacterized damage-inducible protein DinB